MRKTKRKFLMKQIYDHTGIKRKLEKLAEDGWKLEKIGGMGGYKFRRTEPQKLQYSVVYFPEASEFDADLMTGQREFIELCEQSGWEYIDSMGQMMVFCSKLTNPIPIETDAVMQVETVHKAMKKSFLPGQFGLLALAILQLVLFAYRIKTEPVNLLLQDALLVSLICYGLIFVMSAHHISDYFLWRKKALAAAADGVFVETKGSAYIDRAALIVVTAVFAGWLLSMLGDTYSLYIVGYTFAVMGAYIAVIFGVKALMKKLKYDRDTNKLVTFGLIITGTVLVAFLLVFEIMDADIPERKNEISDGPVSSYIYNEREYYVYDDPILLTLDELGIEADYESCSRVHDVQRSLLMTVYTGQEIAPCDGEDELPELYYTLTIPKLNMLLDLCAEDILDDRRIRTEYGEGKMIDGEAWQAEQVYERTVEGRSGVHYTVVWEDRVLEITLPMMPTEEQLKTIIEQLKTYEP